MSGGREIDRVGSVCYDLFGPGKQRSKKEAEMNTNRHNPGGHERKIATKLINMEKNLKTNKS